MKSGRTDTQCRWGEARLLVAEGVADLVAPEARVVVVVREVVAHLAADRARAVLLEPALGPLVLVALLWLLTAGDLLARNVLDALEFVAYFVNDEAADEALARLADEHVTVDDQLAADLVSRAYRAVVHHVVAHVHESVRFPGDVQSPLLDGEARRQPEEVQVAEDEQDERGDDREHVHDLKREFLVNTPINIEFYTNSALINNGLGRFMAHRKTAEESYSWRDSKGTGVSI